MVEERHQLTLNEESIPVSIHRPGAAAAAVVLMGHGLGADRSHPTMLAPISLLTGEFNFAVVCPDLPLHGERRDPQMKPEQIVETWQTYWAGQGRGRVLDEWQHVLAFAGEKFPGLPVVYFGLSLGTQYGVLFLSRTKGISAAVLGLFGSDPPPKSIVMNRCAPEIQVPVYFILKESDEIHPKVNARHLFDSIGSMLKVLDSTPGHHGEVSAGSVRKAALFLKEQIDA